MDVEILAPVLILSIEISGERWSAAEGGNVRIVMREQVRKVLLNYIPDMTSCIFFNNLRTSILL